MSLVITQAGCGGVPIRLPFLSTATPTPTNTPIPPTATPNIAATQSVRATQTAQAIINQIKAELEEKEISTETGRLGWVQTETISLDIEEYHMMYYNKIAEKLVASDFVIQTEITWDSTSFILCGFMFRSASNFVQGKQYKFLFTRLSGFPGWDIEFWNLNEYKNNVTEKVRFSSALNLENGSTNKVLLMAEGNEFTVFINDIRQGKFFDYSNLASSGRFAVLAWQDTGKSTCTFRNSWIWVIK